MSFKASSSPASCSTSTIRSSMTGEVNMIADTSSSRTSDSRRARHLRMNSASSETALKRSPSASISPP